MDHDRLALAMRRDIFGQVGQLTCRQQIEQPRERMVFQAIVAWMQDSVVAALPRAALQKCRPVARRKS